MNLFSLFVLHIRPTEKQVILNETCHHINWLGEVLLNLSFNLW